MSEILVLQNSTDGPIERMAKAVTSTARFQGRHVLEFAKQPSTTSAAEAPR